MRFSPSVMTAALTLPLVFVACQPQPADQMAGTDSTAAAMPANDADATAAIDSLRSMVQRAYNQGDRALLASAYADDAIEIGPDGSIAHGGQAMADAAMADTTMRVSDLKISPDEGGTTVVGDVAYESGTFTETVTPAAAGAKPMQVSGRYLVVLRRQPDGSWKIARDADVMSAPPAGASGSGSD